MLNTKKLYEDFNIRTATPAQRHFRSGWVNTRCPFCYGHEGNHLGYCIDPASEFYGSFVCFRCGGHSYREVLSKLLNVGVEQADSIIEKYGGRHTADRSKTRHTFSQPTVKPIKVSLPPGTVRLSEVKGALNYVKNRGFTPDALEESWNIKATGPSSSVIYTRNGREYKLDVSYSIVIPIYHQKRLVSWQCRDWTSRRQNKYTTCPPELEALFHKHTLYGIDQTKGLDRVLLVEGAFDVWRVGFGAVATFGIKYKPEQIRALSRFTRVSILFDPETAAHLQARNIARELKEYGTVVRVINTRTGRDPSDSKREEMRKLI